MLPGTGSFVMKKIRINDKVMVLKGKDRLKTGKVLKLDWKNSKVLIQGVNVVKKAVRPTQETQGGILSKEMPVSISNIALISPKTKKATRVKIQTKDGKKTRIASSCGSELKPVGAKA